MFIMCVCVCVLCVCPCVHTCVNVLYVHMCVYVGLEDRFEEYPKLKELIRLKDEQIAKYANPPM